jgi:SAM-dependent methyltransferase
VSDAWTEYLLPNDGEEQDRLDFMHELANLILFGRLYAAPLESLRHVLDIGTGTGIWALEFAEQNPESHVIGTDLSMIQPAPRTNNVEFVLENSETQDWVFPHNFDYVHLRAMAPCFGDLRTVIQKSWDNMEPGGWIEFLDGYWDPGCIDDTLEGTAIQHFFRVVIGASQLQGRDMLKAARYKGYLEDAGFVNITETRVPIPGTPWTQDKRSNEMGMYLGRLLMTTVDSYQKILQLAGMKPEEIDALLTQVKYELRDLSIHWYADA